MRVDGRKTDELRSITIIPNYVSFAEGSALIEVGQTRVLCNVTVEKDIPRWMQQQGASGGWITGEYALLPRSTHTRTSRETIGLSGRTQEIRRLIGRSLRAAVNLEKLGQITCIVDCDVIQADGGTRAAAITGGYVALAIALRKLIRDGVIPPDTLVSAVAAVSVGMLEGIPVLDLSYKEDSAAQVDINVVMNSAGKYIEIQGAAEKTPFARSTLDTLLNLANKGIGQLLAVQKDILDGLK